MSRIINNIPSFMSGNSIGGSFNDVRSNDTVRMVNGLYQNGVLILTDPSSNLALGRDTLQFNTSGNNIGIGNITQVSSTLGFNNISIGHLSLLCSTGINNIAIGNQVMLLNTVGINNTVVGQNSMAYINGSDNTILGYDSNPLWNGTGTIILGSGITASSNNQIRIGLTAGSLGTMTTNFQGGIRGATISGGAAVSIDALGQLGTVSSSITKKRDVIDMGDASDNVMSLRPVLFKWKPEISMSDKYQYGLIAEEVQEIMPELVIRNNEGEIETVAYHDLPILLLNELKKVKADHRLVLDSLERRLAILEERL